MANGCISWASQRQKMATLSVGEAEYMELASTGQQAACLKSISREVGFPIHVPIPLCMDNQAVIFLTVNPAVECQTMIYLGCGLDQQEQAVKLNQSIDSMRL